MSGTPSPLPQDDGFSIVAADVAFFRRFPNRVYRLRLAGRSEIEEARNKIGMVPPPPGVRAYCAIRRMTPWPGRIYRAIGFAIDVGETDFDEATALAAYHRLNPQDVTTLPDVATLWPARDRELLSGGGAA